MNNKTINHIENFIKNIKKEYKDLTVDYDYDSEEEFYSIWHNDIELQNKDERFANFVGNLLRNNIYGHGIFNISFSYDYYKSNIFTKCKY